MIVPYYSERGIQIFHGDCRDIIPSLTVAKFDLVLTDPPYSSRTHDGARTNRSGARGRTLIEFESMSASELASVFELCGAKLGGWLISFIDWRHMLPLESMPPRSSVCSIRYMGQAERDSPDQWRPAGDGVGGDCTAP